VDRNQDPIAVPNARRLARGMRRWSRGSQPLTHQRYRGIGEARSAAIVADGPRQLSVRPRDGIQDVEQRRASERKRDEAFVVLFSRPGSTRLRARLVADPQPRPLLGRCL
jgi:hypothetical protein